MCLDSIEVQQSNGGSFDSLTGDSILMKDVLQRKHTTFHASLIAIALSGVHQEKAARIGKKVSAFLYTQQNEKGTWNYWQQSRSENTSDPYPDDLDDTASAIAAISVHDSEALSGDDFAKFTKILCSQETAPGGPYRTWCMGNVKDEAWEDVDIGVNAAIAYALSIHDVHLTSLNGYIEEKIKSDSLKSRYYHDEVTIIYLVSRYYRGIHSRKLIKKLYERLKTTRANKEPLILSMIITSLCRFGETKKRILPYTIELAKETVRGPQAYGVYIEKIDDKTWYSGSGSLTAAFCAEALSYFEQEKPVQVNSSDALFQEITQLSYKTISENAPVSKDIIQGAIDYGLGKESLKNICLLPLRCVFGDIDEAYIPDLTKNNKNTFTKLCSAHLLGAVAYGIFDKASDNQKRVPPHFISIALMAHAHCVSILTQMAQRCPWPECVEIMRDILHRMGTAALWESIQASYTISDGKICIDSIPAFETENVLERKSLGIALAPIIAISYVSKNQNNIKLLQNFFGHYCAARHLHDDAHDWREDFRCQRINSTAARCLSIGVKNNIFSLPIKESREKIENNIGNIFSKEGIRDIAQHILDHVHAAENAIEKIDHVSMIHISYLHSLVSHLKNGAYRALTEQTRLEEFYLEMNSVSELKF